MRSRPSLKSVIDDNRVAPLRYYLKDGVQTQFDFPRFKNSEEVENYTKNAENGGEFAKLIDDHVRGLNVSTESNKATHPDLPEIVALESDGSMIKVAINENGELTFKENLPIWADQISVLSQK